MIDKRQQQAYLIKERDQQAALLTVIRRRIELRRYQVSTDLDKPILRYNDPSLNNHHCENLRDSETQQIFFLVTPPLSFYCIPRNASVTQFSGQGPQSPFTIHHSPSS
jgi:hypothetical protein